MDSAVETLTWRTRDRPSCGPSTSFARSAMGMLFLPAEITAMVAGIATGEVADYQWAALLMAIVWRGMNAARDRRS